MLQQRRRPLLLHLQKDLAGLAINRAEEVGEGAWRVFPKDPMASFKDLRAGTLVNRNRDMNWMRMLDKKSSDAASACGCDWTKPPTALH